MKKYSQVETTDEVEKANASFLLHYERKKAIVLVIFFFVVNSQLGIFARCEEEKWAENRDTTEDTNEFRNLLFERRNESKYGFTSLRWRL